MPLCHGLARGDGLGQWVRVPKRLHADVLDALLDLGPVACAAGLPRYVVGHIQAFGDLAERCVASVQPRSAVPEGDVELRAGRVGAPTAGHGQYAFAVQQSVVDTVGTELAADCVGHQAPAPAALDHEQGDHAVEGAVVIETTRCEVNEVVDGVGGVLRVQLRLNSAGVCAGVCHVDGHHRVSGAGGLAGGQGAECLCLTAGALVHGPVRLCGQWGTCVVHGW
mmetsp:Transcript_67279/g.112695  ORF Transcript_67279/g.112695 Transcript_67279/m.112695 type:complete len:223 (-) Transcript_67279:101-769(-)